MKQFKIGKKLIGEYYPESKLFIKKVITGKHLFRILDAWGIDSKVLNALPEDTTIVIIDELDKKYICLKKDYTENGQFYHFKNYNVDHKTQQFLSRKYFAVEEPPVLSEDEQARLNYLKSQGL